MSNSKIVNVDVDPGDPHNDQMAARSNQELDDLVTSAAKTLAQGSGDVPSVLAVIATTLIGEEEWFPRERLASLLAAASVRLAREPK